MKELIAKLKQHNADILKHYEADDKEAVLKTLEEIAPVLKELEENWSQDPATDETKESEELMDEVKKTLEEVKKYADLYVSAENLEALKKELKGFIDWMNDKVSKLEESVAVIAKIETPSQQQDDEEIIKTKSKKRW